jgi:hypothetical protein
VCKEGGARTGQAHAASPADSLDESCADDLFERLDLDAHCRLCVTQLTGSVAERTARGDRPKRREMAQLDRTPARHARRV